MPRLLRLAGAQMAFVWTLLYAVLMWRVLTAAVPFIGGFLLPLFAGTLALIALSYLFVIIVEATGGGGLPPSPFVLFCALIYLITCTIILVPAVTVAIIFTIRFAPLMLVGAVAMFIFLLPHGLQVLLGYVLAATFAPVAVFNPALGTGGVDSPTECFFRGTLVGMNTAMNGLFAFILYGMLFAPLAFVLSGTGIPLATQAATFTLTLGTIVSLLLMLATFGTSLASANVAPALPLGGFIQGFVEAHAGWLSWLMPMSWVYCMSGWWVFYWNWVGHFLSMLAPGSFPPATWAIIAVRLDFATGSISTDSGWRSNNGTNAYNVGCFSFISLGRAGRVPTQQHEAGHHLDLAAFGSFFYWIGAVNENGWGPIGAQGVFAYSERVAESNVSPGRGAPEVPVWR